MHANAELPIALKVKDNIQFYGTSPTPLEHLQYLLSRMASKVRNIVQHYTLVGHWTLFVQFL